MALADRLDEAHRYSLCPKSLRAPRPNRDLEPDSFYRSGISEVGSVGLEPKTYGLKQRPNPLGRFAILPCRAWSAACRTTFLSLVPQMCHKTFEAVPPADLGCFTVSPSAVDRSLCQQRRRSGGAIPSTRGCGVSHGGTRFDDLDRLPADLIYRNMDHEREDAMKLTVRGPPAGRRSDVLAFFSIVDRRRRLHRQVCPP
jgi:hypothetical protein